MRERARAITRRRRGALVLALGMFVACSGESPSAPTADDAQAPSEAEVAAAPVVPTSAGEGDRSSGADAIELRAALVRYWQHLLSAQTEPFAVDREALESVATGEALEQFDQVVRETAGSKVLLIPEDTQLRVALDGIDVAGRVATAQECHTDGFDRLIVSDPHTGEQLPWPISLGARPEATRRVGVTFLDDGSGWKVAKRVDTAIGECELGPRSSIISTGTSKPGRASPECYAFMPTPVNPPPTDDLQRRWRATTRAILDGVLTEADVVASPNAVGTPVAGYPYLESCYAAGDAPGTGVLPVSRRFLCHEVDCDPSRGSVDELVAQLDPGRPIPVTDRQLDAIAVNERTDLRIAEPVLGLAAEAPLGVDPADGVVAARAELAEIEWRLDDELFVVCIPPLGLVDGDPCFHRFRDATDGTVTATVTTVWSVEFELASGSTGQPPPPSELRQSAEVLLSVREPT